MSEKPRLQPKSLGKQAAYKRMTQRGASPASLKNLRIPASSPILALAANLGGIDGFKSATIRLFACFVCPIIRSSCAAPSTGEGTPAQVMKYDKMQARTDETKPALN